MNKILGTMWDDTIMFENLCSTHQLKIDNVTLSPISEPFVVIRI